MKICILTLEQVNRDCSISGGALRVTGLKYCLERMGHEVHILQRESGQDHLKDVFYFEMSDAQSDGLLHTNIDEKLNEISPDLIIVEQWGLLEWFDSEVPVVVDLHGSLIWENFYKGYQSDEQTRAKLICLSRADGIIVPGERQYYYFLAWAQMAGLRDLDKRLSIVPLVLDYTFYSTNTESCNDTIVMGGATWPWVKQVSEKVLREHLDGEGIGLLSRFYSPTDTSIKHGEDKVVKMAGISHRKLIVEYSQSLAAFDLYELNMERKLAITTRSIEYMYCGLPLIYSEGLELSDLIEKYELGILVKSPEDLFKMKELKTRLLDCKENLKQYKLSNHYFDKAQESLQCILNLRKKKNILSPLTKIEVERRSFRKRVGELESLDSNTQTKHGNSFFKELWLKDMEEIYKRNLK